jgi:hypothetical protein
MRQAEEKQMPSVRNEVWIQNNTVGSTGTFNIGLAGADPGPPAEAALVVVPPDQTRNTTHRVLLGETFPVGDETWRFADVDFKSLDRFHVLIRRVDDDEPRNPPTGKIWPKIRLDPYGSLDWPQAAALETALGQPLPKNYQQWLMQTNGAQPAEPYRVDDMPFLLTPERPLLGVHPQFPPFDLVTAQRQYRDKFLTRDFLVIAVPGGAGGLLVVKAVAPGIDSVWILPPHAMTGRLEPAERERQLVYLADTIGYFLGRLEPYVLPEAPPAEVVFREEPGPDSPWYRGPQAN